MTDITDSYGEALAEVSSEAEMHLEARTILEGQSVKPLLAFFAPIRFAIKTLKAAIYGYET